MNTRSICIRVIYKLAILLLLIVATSNNILASSAQDDGGKFNPSEMIMHHVRDAHEIHIGPLHIPLPVIAYSDQGVDVFSSSNLSGHDYTSPKTGINYHIDHNTGALKAENTAIIDLSITKSVAGMFLVVILMFFVFRSVANSYRKRDKEAPKGLQSFMEPLILFIRDEVAIPSIGRDKAERYMPFLLTTFFFIWICNILGLIPFLGGFNITGTLSVTMVLAAVVFIITIFSGNKHYWGHILWPPGVPLPVKIILVPIELAGIFIKPFVLMVRLTANITAGHIIILSFVSLIFIFGQDSPATGYGVGVGSVLFMIFMNFIEFLVAFIQAYVFTLLSALYFGAAVEEAHH